MIPSKILYEAQKKPLAKATWDTILVHFVQMLLNSPEIGRAHV